MLAPILGAVGSLVGTGASYLQGRQNARDAQAHAARQEALQREFAQNGISWKVEDAKRAGIHPLYALGASTQSYAPTTVGSSSTDFSGLGEAGQNIGRAIDATRPNVDKQAAALQTAHSMAQLEGAKLDNDIKRAQLASTLATRAAGPGMAPFNRPGQFDGQGDAIKLDGNKIKLETRRDISDPKNPSYIPGSGPSVGVVKNSTGGYSIVMPPELAESYESDGMGSLDWQIRNRVMPFFTDSVAKPNIPHNPLTEEIIFNPWTNDYSVRKRTNRNEKKKGFRFPPWAENPLF